MVAGIFHSGSGLGDQLFRYITVRTLAEEKGYEWGMIGWENFKGDSFMNLVERPSTGFQPNKFYEKDVRDVNGNDIRSYDPEINFIQDNTIIDGSFEDSKYWGHNLQNIAKWLETEPMVVPDDTCFIGFRGGEYSAVSELFLPKSFYFKGVEMMRARGITKFEVHTDDPVLAKQFFPDFSIVENQPISHSKHSNMGYNWRAMRNANHAIVPNSAFFILPRMLKHFEDPSSLTLAPRYWAGHNEKIWKRPATFYKPFTYIHASYTR